MSPSVQSEYEMAPRNLVGHRPRAKAVGKVALPALKSLAKVALPIAGKRSACSFRSRRGQQIGRLPRRRQRAELEYEGRIPGRPTSRRRAGSCAS